MIAVIADDITGAAEIAGIAGNLGASVSLTIFQPDTVRDGCPQPVTGREGCPQPSMLVDEPDTGRDGCPQPSKRVLVIATDTRSMTVDDAVSLSKSLGSILNATFNPSHIFKKTDSVLRGHIEAETLALLESIPETEKALLIPANPSKKRIIRDGQYLIDEIPLHLTDFSFDPEFPAKSSNVSDFINNPLIDIPNVESQEDIERNLNQVPEGIICCGGADFFKVFMLRKGFCHKHASSNEPSLLNDTLIVRGSTQSKSIGLNIPVNHLPREVYDGTCGPEKWAKQVGEDFAGSHSMILDIPHTHLTGKDVAIRLRNAMAIATKCAIESHIPKNLIIEGGATAFAILEALGWNTFTNIEEISPGVVAMLAPSGTKVTLKPGSYPWGKLFGNI